MAYSSFKGMHTADDGTLYVAGTRTLQHAFWRDMWDDMKLPYAGVVPSTGVRNTFRYNEVKTQIQANPRINRLVGHSLGGAVVRAIAEDYPNQIKDYEVYGTPGVRLTGNDPHSFRYRFDPISIFDRAAQSRGFATNPHGYT